MSYPYDEIKKIHDDIKGHSITSFSSRLLEAFHGLTADVPYQTTSIPDSPEDIPFRDMGINQKVLNVAISNLSAFLLSGDINMVSRIPMQWATDNADKDSAAFLQHLSKWVTGSDYRSVANAVYLAHYETEIRKRRSMESGNIVLPGSNECNVIIQLVEALMKAMDNAQTFTYRVDSEAGYNEVVDKGDIDFLVNDTLYISRLGRVYSRDRYYLLICYILMKQSAKYKDVPVHHVCLVSPSDGVCYRVDIRLVEKRILDIIHDCIYGPVIREVIETSPSRKRRVTLVMGVVSLFDAVTSEAIIAELTQVCLTYQAGVSLDHPRIKSSFDKVVAYFSTPKEKEVEEEQYYFEGISHFNQLLFDIENKDQEPQTVRLSDELTQDILHKALDF